MKNGLVIADSGPIFSLALLDKLDLLNDLFDEVRIAQAVWEEISFDKSKPFSFKIRDFFNGKVIQIQRFNDLTFTMDYGESQSVILYKELNADFLLIDDKKARNIAENFGIKCIGTIGLLSVAKDKGLIASLRPMFIQLLENKRFYSIELLNTILIQKGETIIKNNA